MGLKDNRKLGESTPPGQTYMDQVQAEVLETGVGPEGEVMNVPVATGEASDAKESVPTEEEVKQEKRNEVEVSEDALQIIEPDDINWQPTPVEQVLVVYVPRKDFIARVNQTVTEFQAGVPKHIDRDLANMLLEDEERGYVRT